MTSEFDKRWWDGDAARGVPFWERVTYPQQRDPSGFEVVSSMEELNHMVDKGGDRPGDTAIWSFQLQQFLASKSNRQVVDIDPRRPYQTTIPHEARVFELFPGGLQTGIHGRLHHVSLDFTYTSLAATYNSSRPGWDLLQGRLTDFGVSLQRMKKVPYTAVSYVWGSGGLSHVVKLPGHDLRVTATVDTILRRLRDRDRPTYLWIDQICIDQTDLNDKSSQVQLMGTIYARARNTVAWLGDEPDHGALRALQGLSEATMGRDEDLLEDELEYLRNPLNEEESTFDNLLKLSNRPWFQRTWIVQEAILSRSLFLMVGLDTVYWDDLQRGFPHSIARRLAFKLFDLARNAPGNRCQ